VNHLTRARLKRVVNYDDARRLARGSLPRPIFDYVDGGTEDEVTLRRNTAAFREIFFRPRMAEWVPEPDLATTVLGQPISFPVITAPCGGVRLIHPDGDPGVARAVTAAGTFHISSSAASYSLEEIMEKAPGPHWFQLYRLNGRAGMENLVHRATNAGYRAIVATVDTQVGPKRERDWRNGFNSYNMRVNLRNAVRLGPKLAPRPCWVARYVRDGMPFGLANTARMAADGVELPLSQLTAHDTSSPTWGEIAWIRDNFAGKVVVKGVLSGEDAKRALDLGCDAVIVSNHGGRQLEGAPATIDVLPEVVDAVGDRMEVLLDSGVRRGGDVIKALATGAKAVVIGRPYVWGLAVAGTEGVTHMLDLFRAEITLTMQLLGCRSVQDLDRSWLM
jgi:isopentenyl diphosphate isomerase/L-lactate dehydrogenase-like FMN-dependent dehydrogenase